MRFIQLLFFVLLAAVSFAQTPVPMASQPSFTYTESFTDIANWTNNFAAGTGANRFASVAIGGGAIAIPNATKITTSTATFTTGSAGGVQRGTDQSVPTNSIVLVSTGTSDNTSSAAIDLFLDFTWLDAGTISFDWSVIFSGAGSRTGSLRVYASTDGTVFTDVTTAFVLNFVNNVAASGSISNVALPAGFNNSATARLRFYYHNGLGGSLGARPKISIDNISVTALPNTPCVTPAAQPTNLVFGTITPSTINGSFTAASPVPNSYLVIASNNNSLTSLPVDGINYNLGDNIGDGFVVANGNTLSFLATALSLQPLIIFIFFR